MFCIGLMFFESFHHHRAVFSEAIGDRLLDCNISSSLPIWQRASTV